MGYQVPTLPDSSGHHNRNPDVVKAASMMSEYVRPSYLEELPPAQRLPDYVPAAPVLAAAESEAGSVSAPAAATAATPVVEPQPVANASREATTAAAEKQMIKLTGRISSAVHLVDRGGSAAVSFSLVVTDTAGASTTHRVYATKQFAERLAKQQLAQGMSVEAAGQPQLREERQPDGATKAVHYLYCFGVRVLATSA